MNSNFLRNHPSPSMLTGTPGGGLVNAVKSLLCLVLCVLSLSASAQNLLVNGDFEAGQLAPWQGGELHANPTGGVCARIGDPFAGSALSQMVPTVVGQRYVLSAELRSEDQFPSVIEISAQAQTGDFDGSRLVLAENGAFQRFTLIFTASAAGALIEISGDRGDFVLIDNVSLMPIPPAAADKSYAGMMVTTVVVSDPPMITKSSRKVNARINGAGELILLDGIDGIITGTILPSGEFSLTLPGGTTVTGTATIRGRRIILHYVSGSHAAVTPSGGSVANTINHTLTLTRR